jgi:hypothetical protein
MVVTPERVRRWLLLAAFAVLVQQLLTVYPPSQRGAPVFWGSLSLLLLWLVLRGSNVARCVFGVSALVGLVLFLPGALAELRSALLAVAYGVQAASMLVTPVRQWTRPGRARPARAALPAAE